MSDTPKSGGLTADKQALLALRKMRARIDELERARSEPIAIVGAGCRLPGGVTTPEQFWSVLREGTDAVGDVPRERWDIDAYYDPDPDAAGKMYTRRGGFLDAIDGFDPRHFGITPREAISMDPQQRLLLEVTWEALERAGVAPDRLNGSETGVFIGISTNDYGQILLQASDQIDPGMYFGTGNLLNAAAGRLSYVLGLQGPSMAIDTACSSSLVAIHLACQSLRNRECRMALAGGANLVLVPEVTVNCCRAKMLAPDGRCKTFDAAADGYVRGEGAAVIVLKRLSDALADGDPIVALIRGSAVNQDGRSGGFTAPNELAQQAVIKNALAAGGVAPADIGYVEAHGTGTSLGDPIEIHAITAALGAGRARPLVVGSVKTNLGHLEAAAGVTGLLKVALALQHGEIPPHLHFQQLNPHIEVGDFPLEIPRAVKAWPRGVERRLAGVSSFGFTGTNAHVILEEAPPLREREREPIADRPVHVLPLSARTDAALRELAGRYAAYLDDAPAPLGDVCATAAQARAVFDHRVAIVASQADEARERLREFAAGSTARVQSAKVRTRDEGVVFLFTGQGAQYAGMGKGLYDSEPVFRAAIDRCAAALHGVLGRPLESVLFPAAGESSPIDDTVYAQPAIFAIEYALSELWRSWGVQPSAVLGHSIGEFAAAVVAGVLELEDALKLVAARGRLMQQLPAGGAMAAVMAAEARVRAAIAPFADRVSIAALNGPANTVVSGAGDAVGQIIAALAAEHIPVQRLVVSHAFHSPLMDPMLDEFERLAGSISYAAPRVPFVSNVTGRLLDTTFRIDAAYWRRHAREAVRFADGLTALHARGDRVFLEIGPAPTLSGMGRRMLEGEDLAWLTSLRKGRDDWQQMLDSVAGLFVHGVPIDWAAFDAPYQRRKALLPTYPFQRERYWVQVERRIPAPGVAAPHSGPETYGVEWVARDAEVPAHAADAGRYVVVARTSAFRAALVDEFARFGAISVIVDTDDTREDAPASILAAAADCRGVIVIADGDSGDLTSGQRTCELLVGLAPRLERLSGPTPRLFVVTRGTQPVGTTAPSVADAPIWGLGRVLALEHPATWGASIDIASDEDAVGVVREVRASTSAGQRRDGEDQIVLRDATRYVPRLDRLASVPAAQLKLSSDGTYLITGGLGSLGLALAERLVARGARSLALVGRRGLPPRGEWDAVDAASSSGQQIAAVRRLESAGATVHVCRADIADAADVSRVFASLRATAPTVRGVIHAAGVSHPVAVAGMTAEILADTLRPKVLGGWRLHEATREIPLDFFVLFSSISSVWGSRTLGAYAAANQSLDALAHHRRALGLPATSINWGPWADGGMMDDAGQQWLSALGVEALKPAAALDMLERIVAAGHAQVVVASMNWERFLAVYEARGERPFMDRVRPAREAAAAGVHRGFVERLTRMPAAERRQAIGAAITEHAVAVIGGGAPAAIAPDEGFFELGFDSLMATELRRRLEKQFDRMLTPTLTFDHPTVEALAAHIEQAVFPETAGEPRAADASLAAAPIARVGQRLSAVQRRLWFFDQFAPGTWFYNIPVTVLFEGRLDVAALERSLAEIIRRHDSLRTTVAGGVDEPVQTVAAPGPFALPIVDLSRLDPQQWDDELRRRSSEETRTPFDLAAGPLIRASLLRFSGERHALFVTSHHIVCDGTSVRVLLGELSALYAAFAAGRPSPLEELPRQFADAIAMEHALLGESECREALEYWKRTLAGVRPSVDLPVDRPRPPSQTFEGGRLYGLIPAACADRLRAVARAEGATLFMTLLAGLGALLYRYTDQSDIVVGTPVAGRHAPGTDRMIGCFINLLPLRCDLSGDPAFHEMVGRARVAALGAFRRQMLPFDRLVEELNPVRDPSRAPVFQIVLNMGNYSNLWPIEAPGLRVTLLDVQHEPSMVDLTLYATEVADGIRLRAVYKSDLFDRVTIEQFLRRFETLIDAASMAPATRVSALPLALDEAKALAGAFSAELDEV